MILAPKLWGKQHGSWLVGVVIYETKWESKSPTPKDWTISVWWGDERLEKFFAEKRQATKGWLSVSPRADWLHLLDSMRTLSPSMRPSSSSFRMPSKMARNLQRWQVKKENECSLCKKKNSFSTKKTRTFRTFRLDLYGSRRRWREPPVVACSWPPCLLLYWPVTTGGGVAKFISIQIQTHLHMITATVDTLDHAWDAFIIFSLLFLDLPRRNGDAGRTHPVERSILEGKNGKLPVSAGKRPFHLATRLVGDRVDLQNAQKKVGLMTSFLFRFFLPIVVSLYIQPSERFGFFCWNEDSDEMKSAPREIRRDSAWPAERKVLAFEWRGGTKKKRPGNGQVPQRHTPLGASHCPHHAVKPSQNR